MHRDISPDNLLVSLNGEVKLIDFGIAKHAERSSITRQGVVRGKHRYLAPEVANGEPATQRSDQFGAGLVIDEMLLGHPVFSGDADACFAQAQTGEFEVPRDTPFAEPLKRALARSPGARFASCLSFCKALETVARSERIFADPELLALLARKS